MEDLCKGSFIYATRDAWSALSLHSYLQGQIESVVTREICKEKVLPGTSPEQSSQPVNQVQPVTHGHQDKPRRRRVTVITTEQVSRPSQQKNRNRTDANPKGNRNGKGNPGGKGNRNRKGNPSGKGNWNGKGNPRFQTFPQRDGPSGKANQQKKRQFRYFSDTQAKGRFPPRPRTQDRRGTGRNHEERQADPTPIGVS